MKINETISVNPSKATLGHVEAPSTSIFRSQVLGNESQVHNVDTLQLLFPATKNGLGEFNKYSVPIRTLFATILIVTGISLLSAGSSAIAICSLCFGAFLAIGLLTRPVMLSAAVYYCICGALSLRAGTPDLILFSLMFGSLIFGVVGSGKYSCDTLIRSAVKRQRRNRYQGYKAFHQAL